MSRVIVSIISEQTIPNYIFIKEKYIIGDELLFISSQKMEPKIEWIVSTLGYVNCKIAKILLVENEEEKWFRMCNKIRSGLSKNTKYIVNLTGGTKYISMAVLSVFEGYDTDFLYIPFPKNDILILKNDQPLKLNYRVNINEYLSLYKVLKKENPIQLTSTIEYTTTFFEYFTSEKTNKSDFEILDKLRDYRDKGIKDIGEVQNNEQKNEKMRQINGLIDYLKEIQFEPNSINQLSKHEIQYLTGGWFEEYIFNKIKMDINPQDIALGLKINRTRNPFLNDLDVVFTLGNKLFVVECKTGILNTKMFNETVYKATALKETLFGLPGNTFIFSLGASDEKFEITAKNMGITYYDRSYFTDKEKWKGVVEQIKSIAKN